MIRFFKSLQAATLFIIPVIVVFLWAQSFFGHSFSLQKNAMPLQNFLVSCLAFLPGFIQVLVVIVLVSFEAIYLNIILNKHEVLYRNSYLPAFMYVLLMSCTSILLQFHSLIVVNLLMLIVLDKIFSLFKVESPITLIFDSSFLIAVASLIYLPAVVFFVLFLLSLSILRQFNLREWVIAFVGFLLPYFFLSVYFVWTDQLETGWNKIAESLISEQPDFNFLSGRSLQALFIVFGLLFVFSLYKLKQNFYKNVVRTRSYQQILFFYLLVAALSSMLLRTVPLYHFTVFAIPLAVSFSYYFLAANKRPIISELILWLMIGVVIWNHL